MTVIQALDRSCTNVLNESEFILPLKKQLQQLHEGLTFFKKLQSVLGQDPIEAAAAEAANSQVCPGLAVSTCGIPTL